MDSLDRTDLGLFIEQTPLIDTHEHLHKEDMWTKDGPDVLADLFATYIGSDLLTAGVSREDMLRVLDPSDEDVAGRWRGIEKYWPLCQYTGYGQAVELIARLVYGIDEINLTTIEAAAATNRRLRQPGERLRLLRDAANLDHVQVDDFVWACLPDASGPDFFLYDISWVAFARGEIDFEALKKETGVTVANLDDLRAAFVKLFAKYAPFAIAVKCQHAYDRTLEWRQRTEGEAAELLQRLLLGEELSTAEQWCLGDWCLARGVELAAEHQLPFKIHTGYLAGNELYVDPVRTHPAGLAPLVAAYPATCFVLMHIAYPFSDDLIAIAKHFPNVYIDMCWGWAINPRHAAEFLRRYLQAVPLNKLFVFGGDTFWPTSAVAYAYQARQGLTAALQAEVDDRNLTEEQAIMIARRLMLDNQRDCFPIAETRGTIQAAGLTGGILS